MLKFLLPLIAALKVNATHCTGADIGWHVAQAWAACHAELRRQHQRDSLDSSLTRQP